MSGHCRDCWHYNRGQAGCAAGPTVIRPNSSETCRLDPPQFREKPPDTRGWELAAPVENRLVHEVPKSQKVEFETKKGKKVRFRKGGAKTATPKKGGKKK